MWLLHPSPRANGNYAALGTHYAALGLHSAALWRHNVSLWRHNFRDPSGRGAVISQYSSQDGSHYI